MISAASAIAWERALTGSAAELPQLQPNAPNDDEPGHPPPEGSPELREAYAKFHRILDSTFEGIFKLRPDWTVAEANRAALEATPLALGESYFDAYPQTRGTVVEESFERAMRDRVAVEFEHLWEATGEWDAVRCFPIDGGIGVLVTTITGRKDLERELRGELARGMERDADLEAANVRLNHILDSTAEGVMNVDSGWTILYANRRAFEMSSESRSSIRIGYDFWLCFPQLRGTAAERSLRYAMAERKEVQYEICYGPLNLWFRVVAYPAARGLSLFYREITAEKLLQEHLESEKKLRELRIEALSNMAGGLAHEISNPLAIIHGTASDLQSLALAAGPLASSDVLEAAATIVQTSDRAIRILRGLRGFARDAESDPLELASLYEIVEQAIQLQEARFTRHRVALRTAMPPGLPPLLCRETQIGQIVNNLLNNAFDALVERNCPVRWVSVEGRAADDWIELDVMDSGMGIDDHTREHLMEPFFTTKTRGTGMGIGLSLSRAIALEHGGTLELARDTAHTCFRLTLPVPVATAHAHHPPRTENA